MYHQNRGKRQELYDIVPVTDGIHAVLIDFGKLQFIGDHLTVDRKCRACQCAGAKRHNIAALPDSRQTIKISRQHLEVCQQMMREQYRLRPLQMRVARQDNLFVCSGDFNDRLFHLMNQPGNREHRSLHVHVGVQRHLVIAAAGRVQFAADRADPLGQSLFDIHVDIFQRNFKREIACFDICQDRLQTTQDLLCLSLGDDAALAEHPGMRHTAEDILSIHSLVKRNGGGKLLHTRVGVPGKPATPQLCHFFFASLCIISALIFSGRPNRLIKPSASCWL